MKFYKTHSSRPESKSYMRVCCLWTGEVYVIDIPAGFFKILHNILFERHCTEICIHIFNFFLQTYPKRWV